MASSRSNGFSHVVAAVGSMIEAKPIGVCDGDGSSDPGDPGAESERCGRAGEDCGKERGVGTSLGIASGSVEKGVSKSPFACEEQVEPCRAAASADGAARLRGCEHSVCCGTREPLSRSKRSWL